MTLIDRLNGVSEGVALKAPCRAATTANIALVGIQSIDGVGLSEGDRVLVKNQTAPAQNGVYSASSGNWSRTPDFDGARDVVQGTRVYVVSGTIAAGLGYQVTTAGTILPGTSSIAFGVVAQGPQGIQGAAGNNGTNGANGADANGQCELVYVSATSLQLNRSNGSYIAINGTPRQIAVTGPTLSNATMASNALYFIYAYWTGSAVALEFSSTGHVTSTGDGVEIKAADPTRTLVGMVRTNGSSQFTDSAASRCVASWFRRKRRVLAGPTFAGITTTSTTTVELTSAARSEAVLWANEAVELQLDCYGFNGTGNTSMVAGAGVDGAGTLPPFESLVTSIASSNFILLNAAGGATVAEGYHFFTPTGRVAAGTGTYYGQLQGIIG